MTINLPFPPESKFTPMQRAEAMHSLIRRRELHTPDSLAEKIGKPIEWVTDHLRLYDEVNSRN